MWKGTYLSSHIDRSLCKTSVRIALCWRLTREKKPVCLSHQSSGVVLSVQLREEEDLFLIRDQKVCLHIVVYSNVVMAQRENRTRNRRKRRRRTGRH